MAKCDEGYLCEVCGQEVEGIAQSDLYLRYVIGMVDPETLHTKPERHIRCNPTLAQFIVDETFEPIRLDGEFAKSQMDEDFVRQREEWVTRGWRRLHEITQLGELSILAYPLDQPSE